MHLILFKMKTRVHLPVSRRSNLHKSLYVVHMTPPTPWVMCCVMINATWAQERTESWGEGMGEGERGRQRERGARKRGNRARRRGRHRREVKRRRQRDRRARQGRGEIGEEVDKEER